MTLQTDVADKGLRPCRTWETQPTGDERIVWSIDSRDGVLQGPLDFRFLQGKKILLQLGPDQVGMLIRGGELSVVFLEGSHPLSIGNRPDQVPPDSELMFLAADQPLIMNWHQDASLWVTGPDTQNQHIVLRGKCTCHISGPANFFATFLRHCCTVGEPFTLRIIDTLIRSSLENHLNQAWNQHHGHEEELATCLSNLSPEDLNQALEEQGLTCSDLRVSASHIEPEPESTSTGHSAADRVNRS